jgi:hypothetical protein
MSMRYIGMSWVSRSRRRDRAGSPGERGQGTVEYVLLLLVLVLTIFVVGKALKDKMQKLVDGPITNTINDRFTNEAAMHKFKLSIPR